MSERRRLAIVLLVALVARLVAWAAFLDADELHGDQRYYTATAESIAAGDGHPGLLRPPAYPAFLALCFRVFGNELVPAQLVQIALSLATIALVFRLCARRFGARAATLSGLACALSPGLVHYSHFLWSESFAAAILVAFIACLDRYDRDESRPSLALAGVLLGLAALTRESWLPFAAVIPLALAWRARSWRAALLPSALFLVPMALVILPWTIRNYAVHDRFVPISINKWFPIAVGNVYPDDAWFLGPHEDGDSPALAALKEEAPLLKTDYFESQAYWKEVALDHIRAKQPTWILEKIPRNTARLFSGKTQELRYVKEGWIEVNRAGAWTLVASDVLLFWLTIVPGIFGIWLVAGGWPRAVAAAAVLALLGVHVIANAVPRFVVSVLPFLYLYAGPFLTGSFDRARVSVWRWIGASVCAAAVVLLPLPLTWRYVGRVLEALAT